MSIGIRSRRGRLTLTGTGTVLVCLLVASAGCRGLAIASAPEKKPQAAVSPQAEQAKALFRSALEGGQYEELDRVTEAVTAAYLAEPRDPKLALYAAHSHFWRVAERVRDPELKPTVTDHLLVAAGYFRQARQLNPDDARILGWLGGTEMALGKLHADERLLREGYFTLEDGVSAFPEFNQFSKSYALSTLPRSHPRFAEALESMWASIEVCYAEGIDRERPDYAPYFRPSAAQASQGPTRVCHNHAPAPHNFEGFFLHNGDLLVKAGKPQAARVMYENARLEASFRHWPFRELLEERIRTAAARAQAFAAVSPDAWPEMMVNSRASCSGCHQR